MSSSLACGLGRSSLGLARLIDITGTFGSTLVGAGLRGGRMRRVVGCIVKRGAGFVAIVTVDDTEVSFRCVDWQQTEKISGVSRDFERSVFQRGGEWFVQRRCGRERVVWRLKEGLSQPASC